MSPQSRRSQPAGGQPPGGSGGGRRRGEAPPPNALFAELLRAARELLAVRSPLDAELMVSELLGTWWGQRGGGRRAATVEQLVGEGLVDYAGGQRSPAALALLSGIACLGTPRQATSAEQAALALMERGVARPGWAEHVGAPAPDLPAARAGGALAPPGAEQLAHHQLGVERAAHGQQLARRAEQFGEQRVGRSCASPLAAP